MRLWRLALCMWRLCVLLLLSRHLLRRMLVLLWRELLKWALWLAVAPARRNSGTLGHGGLGLG